MVRTPMFRWSCILVALVASPWLRAVAVEPLPTVALTYVRGEGAASCPGENDLRRLVAARLGVSPFSDPATLRIHASVTSLASGLEARVDVRDADGHVRTRQLRSSARDCRELADAMVLTLSIAIDPMLALAPAREPAPEQVEPPPPEPPAPPPHVAVVPSVIPPPIVEPSVPVVPVVSLGVVGVLEAAPQATAGVTVSAGVQRGAWSLSLEGRADLPATKVVNEGTVSTSLAFGALVPCVAGEHLGGCALVAAGAQWGTGEDLRRAREVSTPYLAVGARVLWRIRVAGPVSVRLHVDTLAPLARTSLLVGDEKVWSTPPLAFAGGLALESAFP